MKGACQRCGCTQDDPCKGGCAWVDEGEDLCDRCAAHIVGEPVPENDLAALRLHFRAFTCIAIFAIARLRGEQAQLRRAIDELTDGTDVERDWGEDVEHVHPEIWTPWTAQ